MVTCTESICVYDRQMTSQAARQVTCAVCGGRLLDDETPISMEPLIDPSIRYIYVHWNCHSFVYRSPVNR